jgi:signal transduction histidine kinase
LVHELDQVLEDDLREVSSAIKDARDGSLALIKDYLTRMAESHEHHGWYVKLFDPSQRLVWASPDARRDRPIFPPAAHSPPVSIEGYRILDKPLTPPLGQISHVRVGATLHLIDQDMARIDRLVLVAAGAVLVTAPPCGYWLAARATRPVGEIINTAARLRPIRLNERLSTRGTGDELDQLAQTINGLFDRIAAYLDTKRDFLANAAHELRTPLAAIRSSVEVAMDGDRTAEEYEELMIDVIDECAALETLVNQLLLLAETEADLPTARFEPVDLRELVAKSIDMFTGAAESRGITLTGDAIASAFIHGNSQHLRQVMNNLLDNAVKYTEPGGQIHVSLTRDGEHRQVVLSVSDSGPGISPEEQKHIFERFYRAESARTRGSGAAGTGLGLSICQSIIHNHGGAIECISATNYGATFSVRLPMLSS